MRRLNGEDGAVAVFVAILLVVVFGMGALVVDVGHMYWERRQLQTGAEAGALALAAECAEGLVDCATGSVSVLGNVAQPYADLNSQDLRSDVPPIMNHGTDPAVCESASGDAPNPLTDSNTVKVTTETIDAGNGESFLTHVLAPVLGSETSTVTACAIAVWGYAGSARTLPLVISACEYDATTTTTYPEPHPNSSAVQETLLFHQGTGGDEDPCNAQAGHDTDGDGTLPAGFGWLDNNGDCEIVTTVIDGDEWVDKETGNDPECSAPDLQQLLGTVVKIPVFNDFCRPPHDPAPACPTYNNKDKYRIATYAAFYLQGYRLGGPAYRRGDYSSCRSSDRCIVGYFTTTTSLDGEIGGPAGDVLIVQLKG